MDLGVTGVLIAGGPALTSGAPLKDPADCGSGIGSGLTAVWRGCRGRRAAVAVT